MTSDEIAAWLGNEPSAAGVTLAVLHGSRARGDGAPDADWDIAILTDGTTDTAAFTAAVVRLLRTDAVDVVELERASALLRYRAARDGIPLLERPAGSFVEFQVRAVQFWCDAGPVIRAAQDAVLAALG